MHAQIKSVVYRYILYCIHNTVDNVCNTADFDKIIIKSNLSIIGKNRTLTTRFFLELRVETHNIGT